MTPFKRLQAFYRQLRRFWPAALAASWAESQAADRLVFCSFALWLVCVPIAVWMALGQPPWWLAQPAAVVLWCFGLVFFLLAGLPILALPFYGLWLALGPKKPEKSEFDRHWEEQFEEELREEKMLRAASAAAGDGSAPTQSAGSFSRYPQSKLPDLPIRIGGVILLAALIFADRPVLTALYLIPVLGWLGLEASLWLVNAWRAR